MPEINWSRLLDLNYWFEGVSDLNGTPVIMPDSPFFWAYLFIFTFFVGIGTAFFVSKAFFHEDHPFQSKISFAGNNFIVMGLLGFLWFWLRETKVQMLGARFWLLFGFIWLLALAYLAINYYLNFYKLESLYFENSLKDKKNKK